MNRSAPREPKKPSVSQKPNNGKRAQLSQSDLPAYTLEEALRVARALDENYAGGPESPHNVAIACDLSPTSSHWRMLAGAAVAYGMTTGSYSADKIALTPLARRILAPTEEGDDARAFVEAALKPKVLREFYAKYDKGKFPRDEIAKNVLADMGVPRDRLDQYLGIIQKNGRSCGIIRDTKTGLFVALEGRLARVPQPEVIRDTNKTEEEPVEGLRYSIGITFHSFSDSGNQQLGLRVAREEQEDC
jgi:hypothetical protein